MNTTRLTLTALATLCLAVGPALAQHSQISPAQRPADVAPMGGDGSGGASDATTPRGVFVIPPGAGGDGSGGASDATTPRGVFVIPPGAGGDGSGGASDATTPRGGFVIPPGAGGDGSGG